MTLLNVDQLNVSFRRGGENHAVVKDVSFSIDRGEILALVGESGSGKSMTALAILRLLPPGAHVSGTVQMAASQDGAEEAADLSRLSENQLRHLRGNRIAMIFQEPMTALNPLHSIGKQIREVLRLHGALPNEGKEGLTRRVQELLEMVGLSKLKDRLNAYPHELSGGERQRVMIAMAMACEPELLIADEPTTAVDVTIQAQLLALLKKLQRERGLSILLITHDLTIVRRVADRVAVMKQGKIVEQGNTADVFANPKKNYTKLLLNSEPKGTPPAVPADAAMVMESSGIDVRYPRKRHFFGGVKVWNHAVESIALSVKEGTTLGVVGESGSGKSSLAMALLRLIPAEGPVVFLGTPIENYDGNAMRPLRKDLQVVFQDPYGSLNPRMTVNRIIGEGLRVHYPDMTRFERRKRCRQILEEVELTPDMLDRYPHEFSGGQRQRIAIARAMVLDPRFVVLDEPTSALDLTVQSQIIDLLKRFQQRHRTSYLFISHDLRVIRAMSHEVMVMQHGKIVEHGPTAQIFEAPQQAYTHQLIHAALLDLDDDWAA